MKKKMSLKKIFLYSVAIWLLIINIIKIWPIAQGERYYQRLQSWYLLANKGEWDKAAKLENKLQAADMSNFKEANKPEELRKKLNELTVKNKKTTDDWMEIGAILYRVGKKNEAFEAVKNAYKMDPIREDVSKIYFTYQTSLLLPQLP